MSKVFTRAFSTVRAQDPGKPGDPIRFIASTEQVARDGLIIEARGWDLANYEKNPVFLWAHDYTGQRPPIGRCEVKVEGNRLMCDTFFDQTDEFARLIENKYRTGFMNAVSVGWDTLEFAPPKTASGAPHVTKAELLDISAVPVPADPGALKERQRVALRTLNAELAEMFGANDDDAPDLTAGSGATPIPPAGSAKRGAIAPHTTAKAAEELAWNASAQLRQVNGREQLRTMHAWVDEDADPDAKTSYKLPHHDAAGNVVWRGVVNAMVRLLQLKDLIPDGDRKGVYQHLVRHYKQFDKTAPEYRTAAELRALGAAEIRGLFLEDEPALAPDYFRAEDAEKVPAPVTGLWLRTVGDEVQMLAEMDGQWRYAWREKFAPAENLISVIVEPAGMFAGEPDDVTADDGTGERLFGVRVGAVLNSRNRDLLSKAIDNIQGVLDSAKKEEAASQDGGEHSAQSNDQAAITDDDDATLELLASGLRALKL